MRFKLFKKLMPKIALLKQDITYIFSKKRYIKLNKR